MIFEYINLDLPFFYSPLRNRNVQRQRNWNYDLLKTGLFWIQAYNSGDFIGFISPKSKQGIFNKMLDLKNTSLISPPQALCRALPGCSGCPCVYPRSGYPTLLGKRRRRRR